MLIRLFTTEFCTLCPIIKNFLKHNDLPFQELHMDTPTGQTELAFNGVFTLSAPVLQIDKKFLLSGDLFPKGVFDEKRVREELEVYLIMSKPILKGGRSSSIGKPLISLVHVKDVEKPT